LCQRFNAILIFVEKSKGKSISSFLEAANIRLLSAMKIFNRQSANRRRFASFTLIVSLLTFLALPQLFQFFSSAALKQPAPFVSTSVVISQVYGGGGNSGATYRQDFIELFNRGTTAQSLNGWSVQYASSTGTSWTATNLTNVTLQPGQYYLVQEATGSGGTTNLPTPDTTGTIAMSATAGKVILASTTTLANDATGSNLGSAKIDAVAYNTSSTSLEGTPTNALSNTTSARRLQNGCQDTDSNSADFEIITAFQTGNPRNTASPFNSCGGTPTPTPTVTPTATPTATPTPTPTPNPLVAIHDIQGNGTSSPLAGQTVTTTGIVTLLRTGSNAGGGAANGFFLQEPDATADADPNTSEGIFVFTSSVPAVAVGDFVTVTGTVVEFNGLTEISSVTNVTVNSTGNTLPTSVTLTTTILDPTASPDQPQLEKYEGMRMTGSLLTVAPNDNFYDVETILSSVSRQQVFREPGIEITDTVPPDPTSGTVDCCIPRWDENPERLKIDTNGRAGAPNNFYTSNVTFTSVAGPLDYSFSEYRLIPDAALNASANMTAVPVRAAAADEFAVAGYNIENFNNNATQRQKASLTVREVLNYPDIIGTIEIFDLADLQALRDQINNDAVAAGDPNPMYEAYLIEGNGVSGDNDQDVGFLVKTSRVSVQSVTQEREDETFINPNTGQPEDLHDRPPLVLRATVNPNQPNASPVIVINNHLRSFIDIEGDSAAARRVRAKRKAQAESLADLLNDLQISDPTTPIVSVGDYNAFQFSSGYDDSTSVIKGNPTPDDQIVVDQSPDLVNPDFYNLIDDVPADQKYTFIFENTPQVLDQVLVNTVGKARNTGIAIAHVNADFPETPASAYETNASVPERNSDHDPTVSYFSLIKAADLSITKTDSPDPVQAGDNLTYTINVANGGADSADNVSITDNLPAGTTFVSLIQNSGPTFNCTTPAVGANGQVSCSIGTLANAASAQFTLVVSVARGTANGTILSNTATISSQTFDPDTDDNSATATTTVNNAPDLALNLEVTPDPVAPGGSLTYQITLTNNGSAAQNIVLYQSDYFTQRGGSRLRVTSISAPAGFICSAGTGFFDPPTADVVCRGATLGAGQEAQFTITKQQRTPLPKGIVIQHEAEVRTETPEPNTQNNRATDSTRVQ
jgi:uncharacterized protein